MHTKYPITLTEKQLRRMSQGHSVNIANHQLQPEHAHHVYIHESEAKRLHRAARKGKGAKLHMTIDEIEHSHAQGWLGDLWSGIKSAASKAYDLVREYGPKALALAKEARDTDFYQEQVRPQLRNKLINFVEDKPYGKYLEEGVVKLGDETRAFGSKRAKEIHEKRLANLAKAREARHKRGGSFKIH